MNELYFSVEMQMSSSKNFHNKMLHSILRNKMSFFESTPIGRILNRFSKDLNSIEFQLPMSFKDLLYCGIDVITIMIIIVIVTPWSITVLIPLTIIYIYIQVTILFELLYYFLLDLI